MSVDIFGYFAAILTTAAFLPQLIKTLKTKKADDVSLTTLIMFIIGVLSWIIYGYKISSIPILIANLITLILNLLILISKIYFSKKTNLICLSDDSGLEIDVLKKKPGIYSARWGGKNSDFNKAMQRVYKELDKKDKEWRTKKVLARFICALVIYWPNRKKIYSLGKVSGKIS